MAGLDAGCAEMPGAVTVDSGEDVDGNTADCCLHGHEFLHQQQHLEPMICTAMLTSPRPAPL